MNGRITNSFNLTPALLLIALVWLVLALAKGLEQPSPLPRLGGKSSQPLTLSTAFTETATLTETVALSVTQPLTSSSALTRSTTVTAPVAAAPAPSPQGDAAKGKEVYSTTCAACHGPNGEGVKGLGKDMTISEFIAGISDEDLLAFIKRGRDTSDPLNTTGVAMPPKGGNPALKDEQIVDIIAFIRSIHKQ